MKKKLLFLLIPCLLMSVTGCVKYNGQGKNGPRSSSAPTSEQQSGGGQSGEQSNTPSGSDSSGGNVTPTPSVEGNVKVYLVFGQYGQYKGNYVTTKVEALFLENTLELEAKPGDNLPGKEDVTSSVVGSNFKVWVSYNNDGKLTEYTKVPEENVKILYASFSGGSGTNHEDHSTQTPEYTPSSTGSLPTSSFGFLFSDNSFMVGELAGDSDQGHKQYVIRKKAFTKDQTFQLCDFGSNAATWTVAIDPYSFGAQGGDGWKAYLTLSDNKYKVMKDFNAEEIYIKIKINNDQVYFQL